MSCCGRGSPTASTSATPTTGAVPIWLCPSACRCGVAGRSHHAPRWVLGPDDSDAGFATWCPGQRRRLLVEDAATGWHEPLAALGHTTDLRDGAPPTPTATPT